MKTILHSYCLDKNSSEYKEMCYNLKNVMKLKKFHVFEMKRIVPAENESYVVDLETNHLFSNQWNTTETSENFKNTRIFDWFEAANHEKGARMVHGHYLIQTDEMRDIRHNTFSCGYCGKQDLESGLCHKCIGSEYLEKKDLVLLRKHRVDEEPEYSKNPITEEELFELLPIYMEKQLEGSKVRLVKSLSEEREEISNRISASKIKQDGLLWLIQNDIIISGFVYFHHNSLEFSFEVRNKEQEADLIKDLENKYFPYNYKVKSK